MLIRLWATVAGFILLSSCPVWAKSMYITDRIEVAVRSGLGIEQKFIGTVKTGDKVEVLEADQNWSKVRLANGTIGWVASRFLVESLRAVAPVADPKIGEEVKGLKEQNQALQRQQEAAKLETEKLVKQIEVDRQTIQALQQEKTSRIAPELTQLKDRNNQLELQVKEYQQQVGHFQRQQKSQVLSEQILWFLAGSGVLFVGLVLGWLVTRGRKKSARYY